VAPPARVMWPRSRPLPTQCGPGSASPPSGPPRCSRPARSVRPSVAEPVRLACRFDECEFIFGHRRADSDGDSESTPAPSPVLARTRTQTHVRQQLSRRRIGSYARWQVAR
jgi:hypothetical protein